MTTPKNKRKHSKPIDCIPPRNQTKSKESEVCLNYYAVTGGIRNGDKPISNFLTLKYNFMQWNVINHIFNSMLKMASHIDGLVTI